MTENNGQAIVNEQLQRREKESEFDKQTHRSKTTEICNVEQ
jgi:hypothetical protein